MSSSPSPSPSLGSLRTRSQFTHRHLSQMAQYVTSCPLRVIAHVDLDAFYAQCEMVRLGLPDDQPLAVQQWQSLIAINYPARKSGGIGGRLGSVSEAKKACPELIAQHVATWRVGDDKWAYRDDHDHDHDHDTIATDKVSLDPYRIESRKILALVRAHLPPHLQRVEKASIDEVFLDLSAQVHATLLERFPELQQPSAARYKDALLSERLPLPSVSALDWQTDDVLVDLEEDVEGEGEGEDSDWDDVAILIGSEIVRGLRAEMRDKLRYTCSAGIARNKLLSKLGSGYQKPNRQTVVRNRAVGVFLRDFKLTKIRKLGGKLGEQVVRMFGTEQVDELLRVPLDQLRAKLDADDTATWLYNAIRGVDTSEVSPRTHIKSMLSAKSFRPYISTDDQAAKWLRIFVGDIYNRLVQEEGGGGGGGGVLDKNGRRPRTIQLSARHATQTRSRQMPIPLGRQIDETLLMSLAKELLSQIMRESSSSSSSGGGGGGIWPCTNLSLTVGGFEDGIKNNMGIGAFLVKGDAAISLKTTTTADHDAAVERWQKKRGRVKEDEGGGGGGIQRFLSRQKVQEVDVGEGHVHGDDAERLVGAQRESDEFRRESMCCAASASSASSSSSSSSWAVCTRCDASFEVAEELQSHMDWHMAKDMEAEQERGGGGGEGGGGGGRKWRQGQGIGMGMGSRGSSRRGGRGRGRGRGGSSSGKLEQGQRKLRFG